MHFVNDFAELALLEDKRHALTLTDPALGLDAPPSVEIELDNETLQALYFALRDYQLALSGMRRVEVLAGELEPGDILYELGVVVFTVKHVLGSTQLNETEIGDFVLCFCDPRGDTSIRLPIEHKITIDRRLEGPRLSG